MRRFALALAAGLICGAVVHADTTVPSQADWDGARQKVSTEDGLSIAYVQLSDGEGTPLLLIHGYTDNSRSWSLPAPYLGIGKRPIYAIDLRGHGASDAPNCCYGLDSLAHDVVAFMDAKEIEKADIVGHSLGSMTAAIVAATAPERVNKLVLVSSAVHPPKGVSNWLWDNISSQTYPIDPDSQFMLDWYTNPTPVDQDFIGRERRESASRPEWVWRGVMVALNMTDWSEMAARIKAPTMILWGDQDGFFDSSAQAELRAALPNAEYRTFEGFGHNMFWEQPEKFGETVTQFLDK